MAKKKRQDRVPTPSWDRPGDETVVGKIRGRSPTFYMTAAVLLLSLVAIGIVAYGFISDYIEDQQRPGSTAVRVGDKEFDLRYFAQRLESYVQQSGGGPETAFPAVTEQLVEETILLNSAGELGVSATEDEVNLEIAGRLVTSVDSPDFETRLQDELDRTGISEDQFRDEVEAAVLRRKLIEHFTAELPATEESVHYRQIVVSTRDAADEIQAEIEGGADAAQIAMERSEDTATADEGGDAGWVPRGILATDVEETLFTMEVDEVRVIERQNRFVVFQIIERSDARAIDEEQKPVLAQNNLNEWIQEKRSNMEVEDLVTTDTDKALWALEHAGF